MSAAGELRTIHELTDQALIEDLTREQLIELVRSLGEGGVRINFSGKVNARGLARRVRPRVSQTHPELSFGSAEDQASNIALEGENLQAMATLYREHGQVDLILADPPYNTGNDFRYNDKWEDDPNDPGIGEFVGEDDPARHTKWMRFMWPRLQMMHQMLKIGGVLAICIDHRELFHLGQMLDELFDEENRVAIINWEKSAAPRSDNSHVSTSTEYVLVYTREKARLITQSLQRTAGDNRRYGNPDNDPEGQWREGNLTARSYSVANDYGIQSPFTGEIHYPPGTRSWTHPKRNIKQWLEEWGAKYVERRLETDDEEATPSLLLADSSPAGIVSASVKAQNVLHDGPWPFVWFGRDGQGRPRVKTYLGRLRKGKVPVTYWADEEYEIPVELGSTSWDYKESGRSSDGIAEVTAIVGPSHGFETVKPLQLFQKIIQLWCPPDGLVVDPFAGSGTTGHAVLALNALTESNRRFILIEQGRPDKGDSYAQTLTAKRLQRAIDGQWANGKGVALGGGFRFATLGKKVDAQALLRMERSEMVDTVIASHFDISRRRGPGLILISGDEFRYLVAKNADDEGFFLVWDGLDENTDFTEEVYEACSNEAKRAGLKVMYHVYARLYKYQTRNVRFYHIPDRILADFGLDVRNEKFTEDDE